LIVMQRLLDNNSNLKWTRGTSISFLSLYSISYFHSLFAMSTWTKQVNFFIALLGIHHPGLMSFCRQV
jgi:hypothetical protein